jgi:hypothetical protein
MEVLMIIRHFEPAQQEKAIWFLLVSAQLAILLMGALRAMPFSWLPRSSSRSGTKNEKPFESLAG